MESGADPCALVAGGRPLAGKPPLRARSFLPGSELPHSVARLGLAIVDHEQARAWRRSLALSRSWTHALLLRIGPSLVLDLGWEKSHEPSSPFAHLVVGLAGPQSTGWMRFEDEAVVRCGLKARQWERRPVEGGLEALAEAVVTIGTAKTR
jgi:hypothetical protein